MKKILRYTLTVLAGASLLAGCQKMEQPALGDYPEDTNPPGGPLKFYVAFDGTTSNPLMNAVDSIRANFPAENPLASVDGVSGKAIKGESQKYVKYPRPNDWASTSKSFTISTWYRKDGQTKNNINENGPEYIMSFKSDNGHWSGASMLFFLEGNNAGCAIKVMLVDANNADGWMTWEGGDVIPGLLDNQWHHLVLTYDASNSVMTLYIDGVASPKTRNWGSHGDANFAEGDITEMRIGAGPSDSFDSGDWLAASFKGEIDQVRMYNEKLTQAEFTELFTDRK